MKATKKIYSIASLVFACCACTAQSTPAEARTPTPKTESANAGTERSHLIFHAPMEDGVYSDDWYSYPLDDNGMGRSFFVTRDGKSGDFAALLSLDCTDKSSNWQWGIQYGSSVVDKSFFKEDVPRGVLQGIIKKYCK